ncbi:hypothetical protein [Streptomyces mirabilis]|uniref:hypothetical protein n=1 Tax=Streptomyces mirabilis TaxID=68239 RepID=UPI0022514C8D|nr:hypothetical protein [Streptomyces mirabilis]MCX4437963.1 hypothetical protein [Streptomyces mirabilis]
MPRATVLDPAKGWIDAMLREDLTAPRKQKHTARRIYQRLAQNHGFDQASYSTVCDYVLVRRPRIALSLSSASDDHKPCVTPLCRSSASGPCAVACTGSVPMK